MALELLTYAASLATLTGVRLRDVVTVRSDRDRLARIARRAIVIRRFLAGLEEPDDPVVGYWQLAHWQLPAESLSVPGRLVSGGLAIYFRERDQRCWHGTMCLSYYTRLGWWDRRKEGVGEPPFVAAYEVRFRGAQDGYTGTSHMVDKVYYYRRHRLRARLFPGPRYEYTGTFSECSIDGSDSARSFRGVFENPAWSGERGKCTFRFHVPRKWGMVEDDLLSG